MASSSESLPASLPLPLAAPLLLLSAPAATYTGRHRTCVRSVHLNFIIAHRMATVGLPQGDTSLLQTLWASQAYNTRM